MKLKILVTYREPNTDTMKKFGTEIWPIDEEGMNIGIKNMLQELEMNPKLVKPFGANKKPVKDEDQFKYAGEGLYRYFSQEEIEFAKKLVKDNDGLVLPGGLMTTLNEQLLVRLFDEANKPILGICAGQNVVNKALGGTITNVEFPDVHNNENVHFAHTLRPNYKTIKNNPFDYTEIPVNSIHNTIIGEVAPGLEVYYYDNFKNPEIVGRIEKSQIMPLNIDFYKKLIITSRMHPESALFYVDGGINEIFSMSFFQTFKEGCKDSFYNYILENDYIPEKLEKSENLDCYINILRFLYFNSKSRDEFFERRLLWIKEKRETILNVNCDIGKLNELLEQSQFLSYDEQIDDMIGKIFTEILFNGYCLKNNFFNRPGNPKHQRAYQSMILYKTVLRLIFNSEDIDGKQKKELLQNIFEKSIALIGIGIFTIGKKIKGELEQLIQQAMNSKYKDERVDMIQQIMELIDFEYYFYNKVENSNYTSKVLVSRDNGMADEYITRRDLYHELLRGIYFNKYLAESEKEYYLDSLNGAQEIIFNFENDFDCDEINRNIENIMNLTCREEIQDLTKKLYGEILSRFESLRNNKKLDD